MSVAVAGIFPKNLFIAAVIVGWLDLHFLFLFERFNYGFLSFGHQRTKSLQLGKVGWPSTIEITWASQMKKILFFGHPFTINTEFNTLVPPVHPVVNNISSGNYFSFKTSTVQQLVGLLLMHCGSEEPCLSPLVNWPCRPISTLLFRCTFKFFLSCGESQDNSNACATGCCQQHLQLVGHRDSKRLSIDTWVPPNTFLNWLPYQLCQFRTTKSSKNSGSEKCWNIARESFQFLETVQQE